MNRPWLILAVLGFVLLAGCGPLTLSQAPQRPAPLSTPQPGSSTAPAPAQGPAGGLRVVPASSHVTGTYPAHCRVNVLAAGATLPDPGCTPGSVRADVTAATMATTICRRGWTATVRPPESETSTLKRLAITAYRIDTPSADVELDHDLPIELGGSNDVTNLWPQPSDIPGAGFRNTKDQVENRLHDAVCAHRVALPDAQRAIAANWTTAEHALGLAP